MKKQETNRLLSDHLPYTLKGQRVNGSSPIGTLVYEPKILEGQTIEFSEITLLREHIGGY